MGKKAQTGKKEKKKKTRKSKDEKPDWPGLPKDVIQSILIRVPTIPDFFAAGGVCSTWRWAWKDSGADFSASQSPLLLLSHIQHHGSLSFYSLTHGQPRLLLKSHPPAHNHYCIGFSYGYLILVNELHQILLLNPFTDASIAFPRDRCVLWNKFGLLTAPPSHPSCTLLLFTRRSSTFQFCPVGGNEWTIHTLSWPVLGAITVGNVVYVLTSGGRIVTVGFAPRPRINLLAIAPVCEPPERQLYSDLYLVESDGQLLMASVNKDLLCPPKETVRVLRLDMAQSRWMEVEELGDCAMFLGSSACGVSPRPAAWGAKQNSIYYVDEISISGAGLLRLKVFNLCEGRAETFRKFLPNWYRDAFKYNPVWVFPRLCY